MLLKNSPSHLGVRFETEKEEQGEVEAAADFIATPAK